MVPDRLVTLLQLAIAAVFVLLIAWRAGFFRNPRELDPLPEPPSLWQVFLAFCIYLGVQMIAIPALAAGWVATEQGPDQVDKVLSNPYIEGWLNFAGICLAFPLVIAYSLSAGKRMWEKRPMTPKARIWEVGFGIVSWLVAFPIVTLVAESVKELIDYLVNASPLDQVAVRHLKSTYGDSSLLTMSVVAIVLLVPVIEEVLFRGFLQSYLRQNFSQRSTILLSSAIFTLAHFSPSQGMANSELLTGLFVLACFLSFIYERQRTLWPSIALHCTFNAVSVSMILMGFSE